jgi:hypothetical protein
MLTRREVMTGSLFGTIPGGGAASAAEQSKDDVEMARNLNSIKERLDDIKTVLDEGLNQPSTSHGLVIPVRMALDQYFKTSGKFPDFMEIGRAVFMDVYDWHVKHQQPLQINRTTDNRVVIRFMFTQLIVRHEQDPVFVGPPFDRPA